MFQDWSSYFLYGSESYRRISDAEGRQNVGIRFLEWLKSLDPHAYTVSIQFFENDIIELTVFS